MGQLEHKIPIFLSSVEVITGGNLLKLCIIRQRFPALVCWKPKLHLDVSTMDSEIQSLFEIGLSIFLLHLRPIYQATGPYHGHEIHMRGIAAQSHCWCSHALWLLVLLHQACFDAAPELPMTWLPAPIQRNCTRPWPMNFGCGATIQPLVASRRATLQGKPSRYSNSTMYCVNAWCDSPIRTCSTLSMRLAMRYGCVNFKQ